MENNSKTRLSDIFGAETPTPQINEFNPGRDDYTAAREAGVVPTGEFYKALFIQNSTSAALEAVLAEDAPPAQVDSVQRMLEMPPLPVITKELWQDCKNSPEALSEIWTSLVLAYCHSEKESQRIYGEIFDPQQAIKEQANAMLGVLSNIDDAQRDEQGNTINARCTLVARGVRNWAQIVLDREVFLTEASVGLHAEGNLRHAIEYVKQAPQLSRDPKQVETLPLSQELAEFSTRVQGVPRKRLL